MELVKDTLWIQRTVLLWGLKSNTCTGIVLKKGWFSLMWGQSINMFHMTLLYESDSPHVCPPHHPSSIFPVLSPCRPCPDPSCALSLSLGWGLPPSSCIFQREIKYYSGSVRCILKFFLRLSFRGSHRVAAGEGGVEQVWWVTWYVLWDFPFVSPTTAGAPL